jgi:hypothetical protein
MKGENPIIEAIKTRRSIRQFTKEPVSDELLNRILESGLWAPSGKNNQPWKFAVIRDLTLRRSLASLTHYGSVIRNAPICSAVFLDHFRVYDRVKDVQAGGCLHPKYAAHDPFDGIGWGVWLGEILKNKEKVGELLEAGENLEFMAVVTLGHSDENSIRSTTGDGSGRRDRLEEMVFLRK